MGYKIGDRVRVLRTEEDVEEMEHTVGMVGWVTDCDPAWWDYEVFFEATNEHPADYWYYAEEWLTAADTTPTELEQLRAENAALREQLARMRAARLVVNDGWRDGD